MNVLALLTDTDVRAIVEIGVIVGLIIQSRRNHVENRAGTAAALDAAAQLRNNGGTTALDKIQAGQAEIVKRLDAGQARFARIETRLDELDPAEIRTNVSAPRHSDGRTSIETDPST